MVKRYSLIVCSIIWFTSWAVLAIELKASVDRNQIAVGETFTLTLELLNTVAKQGPEISILKKAFHIIGQQQASNTSIVNGVVSSSTIWQLILSPKATGNQLVPAIAIKTTEGIISSEPIDISVDEASLSTSVNKQKDINVIVAANKNNPYQNESIIYTVKLISKNDLANVRFDNLTVDNALVKSVKDPQIFDAIQDGVPVKIIEVSYVITPLEAGVMEIPALTVQGDVAVQRRSNNHIMHMFNSFGPTGMLGFVDFEHFLITGDVLILNVKEPIPGVNPWIPAASLKLVEHCAAKQNIVLGDSINLEIVIEAEGILSHQLPDLAIEKLRDPKLKIYADQPVVQDDISKQHIRSLRKVNYTIVPQEVGNTTLPEIVIKWWDVKTEQISYAKISARTLNIIPANISTNNVSTVSDQQEKEPSHDSSEAEQSIKQPNFVITTNDPTLYIIIVLILALICVLSWVIILRHRITTILNKDATLSDSIKKRNDRNSNKSNKQLFLGSKLTAVMTVQDLHDFLRNYAYKNWEVAKNTPLDLIFSAIINKCPMIKNDVSTVITAIQDALYAGKNIDIPAIKVRCASIIKAVRSQSQHLQKEQCVKLSNLNPS